MMKKQCLFTTSPCLEMKTDPAASYHGTLC